MPTGPMSGRSGTPGGAVADATTRDLFRELVTEAAGELGANPSPLASGYLVELLDDRVLAKPDSRVDGWSRTAASLAELLLTAMLERGAVQTARLRALGYLE